MNRFTQDNTEGYTDAELAALNTAYSARLAELRLLGVPRRSPARPLIDKARPAGNASPSTK